MPTATPETIRNRVAALIEALTPTSDSGTRFRQSRDEAAADFVAWAESAPTACLRRFQVRQSEIDQPQSSTVDVSQQRIRLTIRVAYPNNHRYGNGRDRDDVLDEDWRKINRVVGVCGWREISDFTPMGAAKAVESGDAVCFLVVDVDVTHTLDVDG